jgi:phage terminase Nu1 subunit (DNA packaging protein)
MASNPLTNIQRLTESGLARQLGVSRQAVHELVKRGVLSKDKDGLIDFELAKHALMNRVRPSGKTTASLQEPATPAATQTPETSTEPEITSYHVAKTLREAAEAQIARLKLAEMQGDVIQVSAVRATWSARIASARDALLQIPSRLAPVLAAETDLAAVTLLLEDEIRQALAELSREEPARTTA